MTIVWSPIKSLQSTIAQLFTPAQRVRWVALLTAIAGVFNLLIAVSPQLSVRSRLLERLTALTVETQGRIAAAVIGFILLTLAGQLLRHKRVAWLLTVLLLGLSLALKGMRSHHPLVAILDGVLLGFLLVDHRHYTARSDAPSRVRAVRVLLGALLFSLAYGTLGLFWLDHHYARDFDLLTALQQVLQLFFSWDVSSTLPQTRFGRLFAESIYSVSLLTLGYAFLLLLQPVWQPPATAAERKRAIAIVRAHGHTSLAKLTLLDDKSYCFSPSDESLVAFVQRGRGAIALGDPIGPARDREAMIQQFLRECRQNDWLPAFYQVLPDDLPLYQRQGLVSVQIGQEAVIPLRDFSLQGKRGKGFRSTLSRLERVGYRFEVIPAAETAPLLPELRLVSDAWLKRMKGPEKRFSVGWFDRDYLTSGSIAVVRSQDGQIQAFANWVEEFQRNELTLDLIRFLPQAESGTMEFLLVNTILSAKDRGFDSFSLGLSALSGLDQLDQPTQVEQGLDYLYRHLDRFYRFQGLHSFKEKFHPDWQPRYLVYPNLAALPNLVVALIRADSGDRWLDYFRPND
ncbi:bifunctional lysylphosphatidylglycerol flippase/synthetase MprF [Synechococcus elongatus]|uniref:bifunctional lysylphosphatidylglycerol flippase/synthetase MprF n=1 Tax=Synechococcus elongatus TaxID=32046 RepID=UPI0030D44EEE